jgi:glycosidase
MEKISLLLISACLLAVVLFFSCRRKEAPKEIKPFVSEVVHPEWTRNAVVYEVNVRQYTPAGTFRAFQEHLPRLKDLGVDILWFMPIHPIGVKNRKLPLGSYYSVKDYLDVNPEFGKLDDFRALTAKAHEMGFHIIIDWVPNHSSWDNKLAADHPDWYVKDKKGSFIPPIGFDWTDVIQFDWSNKELQDYMIDAMKFWVNAGVDGFRVDHPHQTPYAFWERARTELDAIRPVFMVAENEDQYDFMKKGFDMSYAWELHHLLNRVAQGKDSVSAFGKYYKKELGTFPPDVYRMVFLDNHDENSWNGTINSRMGQAQDAGAVFIFTTKGVPLLYSGQEACLAKSLRFFERDTIKWDTCSKTSFYKSLIRLKKENKALWNGEAGGSMDTISTGAENKIFAYGREKEGNTVVVFLNLRKKNASFKPKLEKFSGEYTNYFSGEKVQLSESDSIRIEPLGYRVYVK